MGYLFQDRKFLAKIFSPRKNWRQKSIQLFLKIINFEPSWAFPPEFLIKRRVLKHLEIVKQATLEKVKLENNQGAHLFEYFQNTESLYEVTSPTIDTLTGTAFIQIKEKNWPIRFSSADWPSDLRYQLSPIPGKNPLRGTWICLTGRSYTHWLFEDVTRFFRILARFPSVGILISPRAPRYSFDLLEALDIEPEKVCVSEIASPEYYIYESIQNLNIMPANTEIRDLVSKIKKLSPIRESKSSLSSKVYVSRRKSSRSLLCEADIEKLFENLGFEIIYAEELNFWQQIDIFSKVDVIVGPHGSGLTNMIWKNKNIKIIEIVDESREDSLYLQILAKKLGIEAHQVSVSELPTLLRTMGYLTSR